ncbi:MAG: hypothetical protein H6707_16135 [Deltaproteobacteria bacterium]|nr:hypothetical protein [Deltaproteobacteria bacterium]
MPPAAEIGRIVGVGSATIDHFAVVDRYPEPGTHNDLAGLSIQGGGTAATAIATLARFGVPTAFVGMLADDDAAAFIARGLEGLGVDVSALRRDGGRLSPHRYLIHERIKSRTTVLATAGDVRSLRPADVDLGVLDGAALLLVDGGHVPAQNLLAEEARKRGIRVLLDAGALREGMGELLALSDVLVASERFASEVAPQGELEDCLAELVRMGPQQAVITLGAEGCVGLSDGKIYRQPAARVEVVDALGAGDVFVGALAYAVAQRWDFARSLEFSSRAAALSCLEIGSRAGLPALDEVLAFDNG